MLGTNTTFIHVCAKTFGVPICTDLSSQRGARTGLGRERSAGIHCSKQRTDTRKPTGTVPHEPETRSNERRRRDLSHREKCPSGCRTLCTFWWHHRLHSKLPIIPNPTERNVCTNTPPVVSYCTRCTFLRSP